MNYLFYLSEQKQLEVVGLLLDEAERLFADGHQVHILVCDSLKHICFENPKGKVSICDYCRYSICFLLKQLSSGIRIHYFNEFYGNQDVGIVSKLLFKYDSIDDIKHLSFENINIGYGALSLYITLTRNLDPKLDKNFRSYFNVLLEKSVILILIMKKVLVSIQPDIVCLYNGRFNELRPIYEVARFFDIETRCYVYWRENVNDMVSFDYSINALPHNIENICHRITKCWIDSLDDEDGKKQIASGFFCAKKEGKAVMDKSYTSTQDMNIELDEWDDSKINIAIFNSSEDEFCSVGDEYDKLALYPSQIEGLRKIMTMTINDDHIHYYLRVHPNLSNVPYKYHTELYTLESEFSNLTIIRADSDYSSYKLLDRCDKVIVFGSTMGIEAVFWDKPVILLAGADYYYLGGCYIPKDELTLKKYILNSLAPLNKIAAYMYGYYYMQDKNRYVFKFDYTVDTYTFGGKQIRRVRFYKVWGSVRLASIKSRILKELFRLKHILKNQSYNIPTKER